MLSIVAMVDSDGRLLTREERLRAGFVETCDFGGRGRFYLGFGPHFPDPNKPAVSEFCIDWPDDSANLLREHYATFEEAAARFTALERKLAIEEMTRALLGPQDTIKIVKPPRF